MTAPFEDQQASQPCKLIDLPGQEAVHSQEGTSGSVSGCLVGLKQQGPEILLCGLGLVACKVLHANSHIPHVILDSRYCTIHLSNSVSKTSDGFFGKYKYATSACRCGAYVNFGFRLSYPNIFAFSNTSLCCILSGCQVAHDSKSSPTMN